MHKSRGFFLLPTEKAIKKFQLLLISFYLRAYDFDINFAFHNDVIQANSCRKTLAHQSGAFTTLHCRPSYLFTRLEKTSVLCG